MSHNETLRELLLQVLATGRQSAEQQQQPAGDDDPAAEFARFVAQQLGHDGPNPTGAAASLLAHLIHNQEN